MDIKQAGKLIIDRLDTLHERNWPYNLFRINKVIKLLVNEGLLSPKFAISYYHFLTNEVEAERNSRKQKNTADHGNFPRSN
ncbi:MAG: hypothetical protein JO266_11390 [Acidobacteria bacterium]|nr:hypothetical protein [Acidobacteriota bacterium]